MEISNLIRAITTRKSCRKFNPIKVESTLMAKVMDEYLSVPLPFANDVDMIEITTNVNHKLFTTFASPPTAIVMVGESDIISQSKVGFMGELYILTAQANGLASCWIGSFNNKELYRNIPVGSNVVINAGESYGFSDGDPGRVPMCMTPIGYPAQSGIIVKIMSSIGTKRKSVFDLVDNSSYLGKLSLEILEILELARLAPSALNGQYWRYGISQDGRTISVSIPHGVKHYTWKHPSIDIGITACHIYLAILSKGHTPSLDIVTDLNRVVWKFTLLPSVDVVLC